jgi:hypothetical protein
MAPVPLATPIAHHIAEEAVDSSLAPQRDSDPDVSSEPYR